MGARMAARLLAAGHTVRVYNRTPERAAPLLERGAVFAATPRAAAEGAELVFSMVRGDEASSAGQPQIDLDLSVGVGKITIVREDA